MLIINFTACMQARVPVLQNRTRRLEGTIGQFAYIGKETSPRVIPPFPFQQNSVRHSLSLNQCFRKVERTDGWQGKKGYFWEINPERKGTVEREIDKWLKEEGRHLTQNPNGLCAPLDLPFSSALYK